VTKRTKANIVDLLKYFLSAGKKKTPYSILFFAISIAPKYQGYDSRSLSMRMNMQEMFQVWEEA